MNNSQKLISTEAYQVVVPTDKKIDLSFFFICYVKPRDILSNVVLYEKYIQYVKALVVVHGLTST